MSSFDIRDGVFQFHKDIIFTVMSSMTKYLYFETKPNLCVERKIKDQEEHKVLCKKFSDEFIQQEKDSHLAVFPTIDNIKINLHIKECIKSKIDQFFEDKPLIPLASDTKPNTNFVAPTTSSSSSYSQPTKIKQTPNNYYCRMPDCSYKSYGSQAQKHHYKEVHGKELSRYEVRDLESYALRKEAEEAAANGGKEPPKEPERAPYTPRRRSVDFKCPKCPDSSPSIYLSQEGLDNHVAKDHADTSKTDENNSNNSTAKQAEQPKSHAKRQPKMYYCKFEDCTYKSFGTAAQKHHSKEVHGKELTRYEVRDLEAYALKREEEDETK